MMTKNQASKICKLCKARKALPDFPVLNRLIRSSWCKECTKQYNREMAQKKRTPGFENYRNPDAIALEYQMKKKEEI